MGLLRMTQICLLLTLSVSFSTCRVLVAADEEAFRSLAQKYAPSLAERLVEMVSQAPEQQANEEGEYSDESELKIDDQGQDAEDKEYGNAEQYEDNYEDRTIDEYGRPMAQLRAVSISGKKPRQMQVNLDELVEKVRARLLEELKTSSPEPPSVGFDGQYRDQNTNVPLRVPVDAKVESPPLQQNPTTQASRVPPDPKPKIQQQRFQKQQKRTEVVESHDLYEKVQISKSKGKHDSYEDYVKNIPKDDDIFETDEEEVNPQKKALNVVQIEQRQEKRSTYKTKVSTNHYQNMNAKNDNDYNNEQNNNNNNYENSKNRNNNYMNTKTTERTKRIEDATFSNYNNKYDDNRPKKIKQTRPQPYTSNYKHVDTNDHSNKRIPKATTRRVEYVDDDDFTTVITTEIEPKAATEFIGVDYKDNPTVRPMFNQESPKYPMKKVPKRIVTNMPIRLRYTISTPNYYEKLPRIAEKYKFDEPIPEKDREQERYSNVAKQPAVINGKQSVK